MTITRTRTFKLQAGEVDDWAVGFTSRLGVGETLTGTPKVTVHLKDDEEAQYAGITVSAIGINISGVIDADGVTHAAGKAVEFRVTAANDALAAQYSLRVECATTTGRNPVDAWTINLAGPPET